MQRKTAADESLRAVALSLTLRARLRPRWRSCRERIRRRHGVFGEPWCGPRARVSRLSAALAAICAPKARPSSRAAFAVARPLALPSTALAGSRYLPSASLGSWLAEVTTSGRSAPSGNKTTVSSPLCAKLAALVRHASADATNALVYFINGRSLCSPESQHGRPATLFQPFDKTRTHQRRSRPPRDWLLSTRGRRGARGARLFRRRARARRAPWAGCAGRRPSGAEDRCRSAGRSRGG